LTNQVTDNRTNISTGESATGWEDIGGTALAVDTEITYDTYTGSIGQYATTTRDATMYNNGGIGLFTSGDHGYLLVNCGVVSLLDTKLLGGLTVRVTGATITDWAEFELFGSDDYPTAFAGGWIQIVVDIDELLANPTNTNGTPPTVGNIQRFGVTFITATVMPRMTDNIWTGGFKRLPSNTAAIIIEGRDSGTTDWNLSSVAAVAAVKLSAVLLTGAGGSFVCRGPIQFGINDTTTHAFLETNKTLLFDSQEVMLDGFYNLSALGNSGGTTNVTFGIKSGTGNDATGAQGGLIQAESTFARFNMDFNDPDIDGANFYGVTFNHGDVFNLDDVAVDVASSLYIDVTSALVSGSKQVRVSAVAPNTADGVAFMKTDDMANIAYSLFTHSDGHAIELTAATPVSQANVGNQFSGYTNTIDSTDAAILNSAAGALEISSSAGSDLETSSYRNTGGGSVVITNDISITFELLQDDTEVRVYEAGTSTEIFGIEVANIVSGKDGTRFQATWSSSAGNSVDYVIHHWSGSAPFYQTVRVNGFTVPSSDTTIDINQLINRNAS